MTTTSALAEFAAGLTATSTPPEVTHQAKRALLDWAGVTLAGSRTDAARIAYDVGSLAGGAGTSPVAGRREGRSPAFAALVNGIAAHVLDYDDTFNPGLTTVHGSAPVWPAVLAAAHERGASGAAALTAFVAGYETEIRVALAAGPAHYDIGWHVTGTVGHLGAAAAVANLLGLDTATTVAALGTAGTQAAGLKAVYGSMGKSLHPGKAAMDGLLSAYLAAGGFTSSTAIVEARRGFLDILTRDAVAERATEDIGVRWFLPRDGFKAYACGSLTHPAIDAVLRLRAEHGLDPADVAAVEVEAHDYVVSTTGNEAPETGLAGKFSVYHCVAVAVVDGAARLAQFTDDRVTDPAVVSVRDRITVRVDPARAKDSALVRVRLADGRTLTCETAHNKGTPENPMSDDDLTEKFGDLAGDVLGGGAAAALSGVIWRMETVDDVRELTEKLRA